MTGQHDHELGKVNCRITAALWYYITIAYAEIPCCDGSGLNSPMGGPTHVVMSNRGGEWELVGLQYRPRRDSRGPQRAVGRNNHSKLLNKFGSSSM